MYYYRYENGEVSCCYKYLMFSYNIIFWLAGAAFIGIGFWAWSEKGVLLDLTQVTKLHGFDPVWLVLVVGGVTFTLGFAGCVGALRENICLLKFFSGVIGFIFFLELTVAVLAVVFQSQVRDWINDFFLQNIKGYRDDIDLQNLIDSVQKMNHCCGAKEPDDWNLNVYFSCNETNKSREKCGVPFSCCLMDPADTVLNTQCGYDVRSKPKVSSVPAESTSSVFQLDRGGSEGSVCPSWTMEVLKVLCSSWTVEVLNGSVCSSWTVEVLNGSVCPSWTVEVLKVLCSSWTVEVLNGSVFQLDRGVSEGSVFQLDRGGSERFCVFQLDRGGSVFQLDRGGSEGSVCPSWTVEVLNGSVFQLDREGSEGSVFQLDRGGSEGSVCSSWTVEVLNGSVFQLDRGGSERFCVFQLDRGGSEGSVFQLDRGGSERLCSSWTVGVLKVLFQLDRGGSEGSVCSSWTVEVLNGSVCSSWTLEVLNGSVCSSWTVEVLKVLCSSWTVKVLNGSVFQLDREGSEGSVFQLDRGGSEGSVCSSWTVEVLNGSVFQLDRGGSERFCVFQLDRGGSEGSVCSSWTVEVLNGSVFQLDRGGSERFCVFQLDRGGSEGSVPAGPWRFCSSWTVEVLNGSMCSSWTVEVLKVLFQLDRGGSEGSVCLTGRVGTTDLRERLHHGAGGLVTQKPVHRGHRVHRHLSAADGGDLPGTNADLRH
ncbi:tetraspanin-14 isoform X34 [Fundulus heteroclitus]|uniref:tetraspanin-14 isoform X34 n=1 Tax=Fundulus heteroclitus TaxID=8078 RepID=UPI00165BBD22|nr:tetraspanin-14 isoform X34 [Fundulus heteroclitus]